MTRAKVHSAFLQRPAILRNTLPKAIAAIIGEDATAKLCIRNGTRSRNDRIAKCPACGSYHIFFRKGVSDGRRGMKCRDCGHLEPVNRNV